MIETVLIFAAAIVDRLRGSAKGLPSKTLELLAYGWIIAALLGHPLDYWTPAISVLFALGGSFGWGEPIGAALFGRAMNAVDYEWWQIGPLKKNAWLALTFRGAMWGAPVLALAYWLPEVIVVLPAYLIAMPLAVLIARLVDWKKWEVQEFLRGGLGAGLIVLSQFIPTLHF